MKIIKKHILNDTSKEMVSEFLYNFYYTLVFAIGINTFKVKAINSVMIAIMLSPIVYASDFIRGYLIPNGEFLKTVIVLCFIDAGIGIIKSIKLSRFNFLLFLIGLLTKLGVSYMAMLLLKSLSSPPELQASTDFHMYFVLTGKIMIMVYSAKSAFDNLHYLTDGNFPPVWYMERMESFNKTGSIEKFLKGKKEEDEQVQNTDDSKDIK